MTKTTIPANLSALSPITALNAASPGTASTVLQDIRSLIDAARQRASAAVNAELTMLYWQVGTRVRAQALQGKRAEYGQQLIAGLAKELALAYGRGWGEQNLRHCLQLAQSFPDQEILYTVCRELSWSHLRSLMYIESDVKRDFYLHICKLERWSVRQLQERMKSMLFERTSISKKPEETIKQDLQLLQTQGIVSQDLAFRDPYVLDFLGLRDTYSENDLETAILNDLQQFISELGSDFAFLARQKRLTIDGRDYKIDLLFYHRRLKAQVVIDLKIGEFEAAFKGQMELYLRWIEKYDQLEGENPPIGLILCAGKNQEHVELLQLEKSNIRVAQYLTYLPSQEAFSKKLHEAMMQARLRMR
jgi:predicted nuclease of restriction endonuclease-like (RecB) superfamily